MGVADGGFHGEILMVSAEGVLGDDDIRLVGPRQVLSRGLGEAAVQNTTAVAAGYSAVDRVAGGTETDPLIRNALYLWRLRGRIWKLTSFPCGSFRFCRRRANRSLSEVLERMSSPQGRGSRTAVRGPCFLGSSNQRAGPRAAHRGSRALIHGPRLKG